MSVFDAAGHDFARLAPVLWDPVSAGLVEVAQPRPGQWVLDACCGVGSSALPAAAIVGPSGRVDAVDTSTQLSGMLREDASRPPWLHVHIADVTTWSGQDRGYDLVQCSLGVFFFPNMDDGVRHLASLRAPGGSLVLSIWRRGALMDFRQVLLEALTRVTGEAVTPPASPIAGIDDADSMRDWLRGLGLGEVVIHRHDLTVALDDDTSWLLVTGTGWRGLVADLDEAQREDVRAELLTGLATAGVQTLDAGTLVALSPS